MYLVELTPAAYKAFTEYLPDHSILLPVWRDVSFRFDNGKLKSTVLSCDEKQIEAMLCLATLHYPEAVPMIQNAMDGSRYVEGGKDCIDWPIKVQRTMG